MADTPVDSALPLCRDLTIRLGSRVLLDKQSLSVEPGSVTVLMGPSGVGKSVLADVLFGLIPQSGSAVQWAGELGVAPEQGSLVFQSGGGLPHLTLRQNVALVSRDPDNVDAALEDVGLVPKRSAERMSGGEQRRLAVARAMSARRKILWLDEPAAGLDVVRMDALAEQLKREASEHGLAVVVTTHRIAFAAALTKRILFLGFNGQIAEPDEDIDTSSANGEASAAIVERRVRNALVASKPPESGSTTAQSKSFALSWTGDWLGGLIGSLELLRARSGPGWSTLSRALRLAAVEGAAFYGFVGAIFGAIFLLIFHLSFAFLDTARVVLEFGPTVVLRLSPAFAGILVAARAGSAVSSWVGQMSASRQLDALSVLGVSLRRFIVGPTWLGLTLSCFVGTLLFAATLTGVFGGYLEQSGEAPFGELLAGFAAQETTIALAKTALFGSVVAAITVSFAREPKTRPDQVATSITRGIVHSTLWIMGIELAVLALQSR